MIDFNRFMQKAKYLPKERVLLVMHNSIHERRTGKSILTDAQKTAIAGDGWHPQGNHEVREFNRYNSAWKYEGSMKLDAQTTYLNAQLSLLQASRLVHYILYTNDINIMERLKKIGMEEYYENALQMVLQNTGLVFDQVVYTLAFQSLNDDLRHDILALFPDAATEHEYLDHEETIAELFDGKNSLTADAKDQVVEMVNLPYGKYSKAIVSYGLPIKDFLLQGYFAGLPVIKIGQRWADEHGISCEEYELAEKILQHAEDHGTTAEDILKTTLRRWLDKGLFVTEYSPLWNSDGIATYSGVDTKIPHSEVFKQWLKAKAEAKAVVEQLVDDGKLKIEIREKKILGVTETLRMLTGESLYSLEGDFRFAQDFKKQVEGIMPLGYLISFLRSRSFLDEYAMLLAVADIYKKLSIVFDIDIGEEVDRFIKNFKESVDGLNDDLRRIADRLIDANWHQEGIVFRMEAFDEDMIFHLDAMKPLVNEEVANYITQFKNLLGSEFDSEPTDRS